MALQRVYDPETDSKALLKFFAAWAVVTINAFLEPKIYYNAAEVVFDNIILVAITATILAHAFSIVIGVVGGTVRPIKGTTKDNFKWWSAVFVSALVTAYSKVLEFYAEYYYEIKKTSGAHSATDITLGQYVKQFVFTFGEDTIVYEVLWFALLSGILQYLLVIMLQDLFYPDKPYEFREEVNPETGKKERLLVALNDEGRSEKEIIGHKKWGGRFAFIVGFPFIFIGMIINNIETWGAGTLTPENTNGDTDKNTDNENDSENDTSNQADVDEFDDEDDPDQHVEYKDGHYPNEPQVGEVAGQSLEKVIQKSNHHNTIANANGRV